VALDAVKERTMDDRGSGWVLFAGITLGIAGVLRIFDAIWAFNYHGYLPDDLRGAVFGQSLTTYGWIYLVEAIILIAAAAAVLAGSEVGRWVGIVAGALACVSAIWMMPFFPVWGIVYLILGVLVVYALATYGGEPASA
jgi:hypothetical protein